jgi:hypothetical protein
MKSINKIYKVHNENFLKVTQGMFKLDSVITTSMDNEIYKWFFKYKGNEIASVINLAGNDVFGIDSIYKDTFHYDDQSNLVKLLSLYRNANKWDNLSMETYHYKDDRLKKIIRRQYIDNQWSNNFKTTYNYNDNNQVKIQIKENWNNNEWQKNTLISNHYNEANLKDTILIKFWEVDGWVEVSKSLYYYSDTSGRLDSIIAKQKGKKFWEDYFKRIITYDEVNNYQYEIEKNKQNGVWTNSVKRYYAFNEDDKKTDAFCEVGNEWVNGEAYIFFDMGYRYSYALFTHRLNAYYSEVTEVEENNILQPSKYSLKQNYPNPFNSSTNISYTIPNESFVNISVYNVIGERVKTLVNKRQSQGNYEAVFDGSGLNSGVYLIRMQADSYVETIKSLLLK